MKRVIWLSECAAFIWGDRFHVIQDISSQKLRRITCITTNSVLWFMPGDWFLICLIPVTAWHFSTTIILISSAVLRLIYHLPSCQVPVQSIIWVILIAIHLRIIGSFWWPICPSGLWMSNGSMLFFKCLEAKFVLVILGALQRLVGPIYQHLLVIGTWCLWLEWWFVILNVLVFIITHLQIH